MIEEFSIENFLSFRDRVTFSMLAANTVRENEDGVDENGEEKVNAVFSLPDSKVRFLSASAIYGANGSGKSNFVNALMFFHKMVMTSFNDDNILIGSNRNKFQFDEARAKNPLMMELVFYVEKNRYRYGFAINDEKICAEWLFIQAKGSVKESYCFKRDENEIAVNPRTFQKASGVAERTRNNALYLSTAAQLNVPMAMKLKNWVRYKLNILDGNSEGTRKFSATQFIHDKGMKSDILKLLHKVDPSINDMTVEEFDEDTLKPTANTDPQLVFTQRDTEGAKDRIHRFDISASHNIYNGEDVVGSKILPFRYESLGTNKMFSLSGPWFDVLKTGGVLIIDEFGSSLHTLLSMQLVKMFESSLNESNAQLIIATHDTNLLRKDLLRRDQIWFAEKDSYGASDLYSLVEYKINQATSVRNDATFSKDYLAGKYGAIPFFGSAKEFISEFSK